MSRFFCKRQTFEKSQKHAVCSHEMRSVRCKCRDKVFFFGVHWRISREHCRGSLRGDPVVLSLHVYGHLHVHSRVHFREHFRARVRGSHFAIRVLCAFVEIHRLYELRREGLLENKEMNYWLGTFHVEQRPHNLEHPQKRCPTIGVKNWTQTFFSNFSGTAGISRPKSRDIPPKRLISLVSRDIPNFLAPTPSCGRPLTHRKVSGLKSLGLLLFLRAWNDSISKIANSVLPSLPCFWRFPFPRLFWGYF